MEIRQLPLSIEILTKPSSFRLLREGAITSWWSWEGSMQSCGRFRTEKRRLKIMTMEEGEGNEEEAGKEE